MKSDTQHLDFLISQYVDGCLEGPNKKSVEQKMLNDPAARRLYTEHRETQDFLDDWGNRIPMIDWNEFDKNLATRLETEAKEKERVSIFRRRLKPFAAAAALLVAASLGYGWHAVSHVSGLPVTPASNIADSHDAPAREVHFPEMEGAIRPSQSSIVVAEPAAQGLSTEPSGVVVVSAPPDATAVQALMENVQFGVGMLPKDAGPQRSVPSTVVVLPTTQPSENETPK